MDAPRRTGLRSSTRIELKKISSSAKSSKGDQFGEKLENAKYLKEEKRKIEKVVVENVLPVEMPPVIKHVSNIVEEGLDQGDSDKDDSLTDALKVCHPDVAVEDSHLPEGQEREAEAVEKTMGIEDEQHRKDDARQEKDDVLSVVIQKLTELVKSSESLCTQPNEVSRSGCSSGANTPPKAVEGKKKPRKRRHKSQLYKCPNCPCLFAIRKRDLKRERKILCACCEKLKQAKAEATQEKVERDSTPLQVVPLESWKVVCEVCSQWVSDYTSLLYHLACHTDVQIFKCKLCDFVTTKKGNIESHQATHRPREINNKFVCSLCKFATNHFAKMEEHLKSHDQKKLLVLKCSVCGYTCRSEEVLRYHMVTHIIEPTAMKVTRKSSSSYRIDEEDDMVFKCTVCGYSCDKLSTLKSHSWRHAGDQSCSYPVEESEDEMPEDPHERQNALFSGSEAQKNIVGSPDQGGGEVEKDEEQESSKDLSRLAIGCCGSNGQACCSKDASGKCQCKSIDVPAAQQPVLEVILNEIKNKTAEAVSTEQNSTQTKQVEEGRDLEEERTVQDSQAAAVVDKNHQVDVSETRRKENDEDKVEDVLEECSTLITGLCNKGDPAQESCVCDAKASQNKILGSKDDQRLKHHENSGSCELNPPPPSSIKDAENQEASRKTGEGDPMNDEHRLSGNDDGSIIVVVESMGMGSLLDDTASVVEVTTSEEPPPLTSPSIQKEDMKVAIKRLLSPSPSEELDPKRLTPDDSAGISNLLLNVVEDLVEKPKCPQGKASASGATIQCPFCDGTLSSFVAFKRHLLDHCRDEFLHSCPYCSEKFASEKLLISHQKEHSKDMEQACSNTSCALPNVEELQPAPTQQAEEVEEPSKTCTEGSGTSTSRKCSMCGRKFRTKASLYLHEQECTTKKKVFPCMECDYIGDTRKELNDHLTESHKKPFKCALCDYTSATPSGIKNHMKFHAVDKPYKCNLCSFSGAYPQSLRSHLKVHASSNLETQPPCEQYKCKLCGYISCHLPSMKSHMWRHARDPGFDYNMVEDVIKDTSHVDAHGKEIATQQNMIYPTALPIVAMPTQENMNLLTTRQADPVRVPVTNQKQVTNLPSGSAILIYKCTQCGFQSNSEGNLVEHLKGHLAVG